MWFSAGPGSRSPAVIVIFSGRTPTLRAEPASEGIRRRRHLHHRPGGERHRGLAVVGLLHLPLQQVGGAEEPGDELGGRVLVDVLGSAELFDPALTHHREPVGHRHGFFLVVGHVDERDPDLLLDAFELELHLLAQLQVERAERLIEEQHLRVVHQGAGQRDPLLLAARHLRRLALLEADEVDQLQGVLHAGAHLVLAHLPATEAEGHVLEDVEVREQRVGLEHGVDVALVRRQFGHVASTQVHRAVRGVFEPADHAKGRGLATPRGPEHREELPFFDVERKVVHRGDVTELLRDALEAHVDLLRHLHPPTSGRPAPTAAGGGDHHPNRLVTQPRDRTCIIDHLYGTDKGRDSRSPLTKGHGQRSRPGPKGSLRVVLRRDAAIGRAPGAP